ncbi:MAG: SUMF1/EgtB/PvdO family nonheme iron enzyme [Phycisphaeraceae bacterium]
MLMVTLATMMMSPVLRADDELPAITNTVGMKLRLIPAGHFQMGTEPHHSDFNKHFNSHAGYNTDDEKPAHPVRLTRPFYMGETEVTVGQFKAFVEATNHRTAAEASGKGIDGFQPEPPANDRNRLPAFEQRATFTWRTPGFEQKDDHPVVGVSWDDAQAYCKWLSAKEKVAYRLPTEAEWEYACRAGSETWYTWGDAYSEIHKQANVGNVELEKAYPQRVARQWLINTGRDPAPGGDGHVFTSPVGSFPANRWGLRDMHGNAWEWCQDHYGDTYYKQFQRERYNLPDKLAVDPLNSTPWNEHGAWRVIRGGCWFTAPVQCRSQTRSYFDATDAGCYLGFRVAREGPRDEVDQARQVYEREQEATRRVIEAAGELKAGENDRREGIRVILTPQMNLGPHLRFVPGLNDVVLDRSTTPVSASLLADVAAIHDLRSLVAYQLGGELTDADLAPLAAKITLRRLDLSDSSKLTDAMLAHLAPLTELRELRLGIPGLTDAGLRQLTRYKQLKTLSLVGTASTGDALPAFDSAPLQTLSIWRLTDAGARHLRLFPGLRELSLIGSPLTDAGFAHIAALKKIERIDLTRCKDLTDAAFAALANLHELRSINLDGTGAGDLASRALASHTQLADLHIGSPALTDAGLEHLGSLVALDNLRITAPAAITDRGLRHLWRLDKLSYLNIECPQITGEGLRDLADLKNLRRLILDCTGITDKGLAQVPMLAAVEQLRLGGNRGGPSAVTDAGLLLLAEAPKLRSIEIYTRGTKITDAGIEALRRAAPNLTIQAR